MSALKDRNGTQKTRNPYFIGAPHKIALYRRIIVLIKRMQQVSCSEKSLRERSGVHGGLVPVVGLEPTRYRYQRILSPSRLPIPSHRPMRYLHIIQDKERKFKSGFWFAPKS